jgi:cyclophilin family peptidyl-prolyl cis-trans isomerase
MVLSFEDTPLFDWFQKNRFLIIGLVVLVVALQYYRTMAPKWQAESQRESWVLYQDVIAQFDAETNVSESLARAKQDDRVYPWFVYAASQGALAEKNREALRLLKPELSTLAASTDAQDWKVPSEEGATAIPAVLLKSVDDFLAQEDQVVTNPEPSGERVIITVTDGLESTYTFTVGLYSEQAPVTTAAFLDAVNSGRFVGESLATIAERQASWTGMNTEDGPNLPKEKHFGIFHLAGALSTVIVPGQPGEQNPDTIQLLTATNHSTDGTTTVFGMVVEGLEGLQDLVNNAAAEQSYTISDIVIAG